MYSKKAGGNIAKACTHNARVSVKNTRYVCKAIRGLYLPVAKKLLEDIIKGKRSINGKYYTKSTKEVLSLLRSAEKNAEFKNLDLNRTYVVHAAALNGTRMFRRRHKRSIGTKMKTTHLEIILKERGARVIEPKKEQKEPENIKEETKKIAEEEKGEKKTEKKVKEKLKKIEREESGQKKEVIGKETTKAKVKPKEEVQKKVERKQEKSKPKEKSKQIQKKTEK